MGGPHFRLCAGRSTLGVMVADRAIAILKTDDMAETIRWYLAAGFELRDQFPGGDPTWCELARDGLRPRWGIEDRDWGRRELVVRDPSGYFLTFAEDTSDEPTSG